MDFIPGKSDRRRGLLTLLPLNGQKKYFFVYGKVFGYYIKASSFIPKITQRRQPHNEMFWVDGDPVDMLFWCHYARTRTICSSHLQCFCTSHLTGIKTRSFVALFDLEITPLKTNAFITSTNMAYWDFKLKRETNIEFILSKFSVTENKPWADSGPKWVSTQWNILITKKKKKKKCISDKYSHYTILQLIL